MIKENSQFKTSSLAISIFQSDIFIYFLAILTGAFIARSLGPEMLGVWILLSLISIYSENFGRLKTDIASMYILGSGSAKPSEVFFATHFFAVVSSILIVLLLFWQIEFFEGLFFADSEVSYNLELSILIFLIPFEFILLNNLYFFLALENAISYNRIRVLRQVVYLVAVVLLINLKLELMSIVIARVAEVFISLIYSFFILNWKELLQRKCWNARVNRDILSLSVSFYGLGLVSNIQELITRTISALFLSKPQLAIYTQGEGAGKILTKLPESLSTILYPRISRLRNVSEAIDLSCLAFRVISIGMIFIGVVIALIAKPVIVLIYGIEFEQSARVLKIVIPGIVIGSSCLSLKSFFEGSGLVQIIVKVQIIPVILQIGSAYLLISLFGMIGAAISFSAGYALYGFVLLIAFLKVNKVSYTRMIPRLEDLDILTKLLMERFLNKK